MNKTFMGITGITGIIFIIILCVMLLFFIDACIKSNTNQMYENMNNDVETAERYIYNSSIRPLRTPLENYRIGNIYDFMLNDNEKAHDYYLEAIVQTLQNPTEDALFIHTRLQDRININDIFETDDNKYDLFNLQQLDDELKELENAINAIYLNKKNNDGPKTIEDRIQWKSDSQNVHDNNINNELYEGYKKIVLENRNNFLWEIPNIREYIQNIYSKEADSNELHNIQPAIHMLDYIYNRGADNIMKLGTNERAFIGQIFTKIYNENDKQKRKNMMENFMLNLKDSYADGTPVCITGRITRIMSSFSDMDDENPLLGIFKTKPLIRNEILTKAAAIRNRIYESASDNIKNKYDNSITDRDTEDLENSMKAHISRMINTDYGDLEKSDPKFIQTVVSEIENSL